MINTDTTEPAAAAATEDDERHTRRRREQHAALLAGLEELTDLLADAGPTGDLFDSCTHVELYTCLDASNGTVSDRVRRIASVAQSLDIEVTTSTTAAGTVHYRAEKILTGEKYAEAVTFSMYTIVDTADVPEAQAALAEATPKLVAVDYRVDHGTSRYSVVDALAQFGVDAILESPTGLSDEAARRADVIVSEVGDKIKVERYSEHFVLPAPADCVSVEAYAEAVAMWVKGTPEFEIPCPARPVHAARAIRSDGSIVTAYSCGHCADGTSALTDQGYTVVWLNPGQVPTDPEIACGLRAEMAGAR
jgi:hypothetical protein